MSRLNKKIFSLLIALFLVASLTPLVAPVQAQVAQIVNVSTPVYPGEPVTVTLNVLQGNVLLNITLANDMVPTYVWASQAVYADRPGTYVVSVTLPKLLPGLSSPPTLYVLVYLGTTLQSSTSVPIYPKIEVNPPVTTVVTESGVSKSVVVSGYGFDPGASITNIVFQNLFYGNVYDVPVTLKADVYGNFSVELSILKDISPDGMAMGKYNVTVYASGVSYIKYIKNATLEIRPQAVIYAAPNPPIIEPGSGYGKVYAHGRCDASVCETNYTTVYLFGFPPNSYVPQIQLVNRNYSAYNINYNFTFGPGNNTNANGFAVLNLVKSDTRTNMTAGDYYVVVYVSPAPQTFTNSTSIPLGSKGTVTLSLPNGASVVAVSYVAGKFDYVVNASDQSYTITDVLRVDFTYGGSRYRLAANYDPTTNTVNFSLYNISVVPYVQLLSVSQTAGYNDTIKAYNAVIYFNITAPPITSYTTGSTDQPPSPAGSYLFWASFYAYSNQILLVLRQYQFTLDYANLSITLTAPDGTKFTWYYEYSREYPGNYSFDGVSVLRASNSTEYGGYRYDISFIYNASTTLATLSVKLTSLARVPYPFLNQYYLVRPVLVILAPRGAPGPYMPGDSLLVGAYGYGPGLRWTGTDNYITIRLDLVVLNASVRLGSDGNATIPNVIIPRNTSFGVHYLKGTDSWGYEYTEAIIIGVKAYWAKIVFGAYAPDNKVSAGWYNNARIEACPCPESAGIVGMKYCGSCAIYAGDCDYLGDYVEVVATGLVPGETVNVSFGGVPVGSVVADANGVARIVFVVPTLPSGIYLITLVGNVSGYQEVNYFYNGTYFKEGVLPEVYPKILLVDLSVEIGTLSPNSTTRVYAPVIVGSGIVRVLGTGFTPGVQFIGVLVNNTDATSSVNTNVARWNANADGILVAYSVAGRTIIPGLWVPMMEPGKYRVELVYLPPGSAQAQVTMPGYVFVINNISIMATKDDIANATSQILSSLSALDTKLSATLSEISGRLDTVISSLSGVSSAVSRLENAVANLSTLVSSARSDVLAAISSARSDVLGAVSSVDSKVSALQSALASARSDILSAISGVDSKVSALSSKIDTLSTSLTNVTSGLSTVLSQLQDVSNKLSSSIASLTNLVSGLSTKLDTVTSGINDVKSAIATVSSKVDTLSGAVSDLKNSVGALQSSVNSLADSVKNMSSKVDTVSSKVDTVASKVDTAASDIKSAVSNAQSALSGQLSTASIVLYVATVLALLAFIFALLAYLSVRKATAK